MRIKPELMLEFREMMAAALLTLKGDFEKEIKALGEAKTAAEQKLGMLRTVADAESKAHEIVVEAEARAVQLRASLVAEVATLEVEQKANEQFRQKLEEQATALDIRASELNAAEKLLERNTQDFASRVAARQADLAAREVGLAGQFEALNRKERATAEREAKLRAAMA